MRMDVKEEGKQAEGQRKKSKEQSEHEERGESR